MPALDATVGDRWSAPRKTSAALHHAADLDDLARFVETIVGRIGIGLEVTFEVLEDLPWPSGAAIRRVGIDYVRIIVVADGNPEPAGLDPLAVMVLDRYGRVVILDDLRGQDLAEHQLDDRAQQVGDDGHPVAHRRA